MRKTPTLLFQVCVGVAALFMVSACSDDSGSGEKRPDASVPDGGDEDGGWDEAWYEPDPQGRTTEGSLLGEDPEMVIVTSTDLVSSWQRYAGMRTAQGVRTEVVALEEALDGQTGRDDAEKLQAFLRHGVGQSSLRFVLLGGDAEVVPFRRVQAEVTVMSESYSSNGPSLLYFANLDADWDGDGDGAWGELGDDLALGDARQHQLAPGRMPASHPGEIVSYLEKARAYSETGLGRVDYPLLVSDVAMSSEFLGDIDAAEAIEVTFEAFFPQAYKQNVRKLYATEGAASAYGGEVVTEALFVEALTEGYSMVLHEGHGSHGWFTDLVPIELIETLANEQPSIFLSCACLSGNYADVADYGDHQQWQRQGPDDDSAGEKYVVGPYGGVVYVGNTATGLGPAGGAQFLHAMLEGVFVEDVRPVGEAFNYARERFREIEFQVSILPELRDDATEWWTQHVVTLLGDPSLEILPQTPALLTLDVPLEYGPGYQDLTVVVTDESSQPVADVTVAVWKSDDFLLEASTDSAGVATFSFIPYGPGELWVGAHGEGFAPVTAIVSPR